MEKSQTDETYEDREMATYKFIYEPKLGEEGEEEIKIEYYPEVH